MKKGGKTDGNAGETETEIHDEAKRIMDDQVLEFLSKKIHDGTATELEKEQWAVLVDAKYEICPMTEEEEDLLLVGAPEKRPTESPQHTGGPVVPPPQPVAEPLVEDMVEDDCSESSFEFVELVGKTKNDAAVENDDTVEKSFLKRKDRGVSDRIWVWECQP